MVEAFDLAGRAMPKSYSQYRACRRRGRGAQYTGYAYTPWESHEWQTRCGEPGCFPERLV